MKYILYLRVSKKDQEYGVDFQRQDCLRFINTLRKDSTEPYEVLEFIDQGKSGDLPTLERPGLLEAVRSIRKGDVLLVYNRRRFGRDAISNGVLQRELTKRGATVISVMEDDSDMDPGTAKFLNTVLDALAEFELYNIRLNTKKGIASARQKGRVSGPVPFGYRSIYSGEVNKSGSPVRKLEKCPTEYPILERIVSLRNAGSSYRMISNELNDDGIPTKHGKDWCDATILQIIRRQAARHSTQK